MGTATNETCGETAMARVAATMRSDPRRTLISLPHLSVTRALLTLEKSSKTPRTTTTAMIAKLVKLNSSSNHGPNVIPKHWLAPIKRNAQANTK